MFKNDSYEFIKHFRHANQCYYRYTSNYYKKMLMKAWSGPIVPVCHVEDWDEPRFFT